MDLEVWIYFFRLILVDALRLVCGGIEQAYYGAGHQYYEPVLSHG